MKDWNYYLSDINTVCRFLPSFRTARMIEFDATLVSTYSYMSQWQFVLGLLGDLSDSVPRCKGHCGNRRRKLLNDNAIARFVPRFEMFPFASSPVDYTFGRETFALTDVRTFPSSVPRGNFITRNDRSKLRAAKQQRTRSSVSARGLMKPNCVCWRHRY